MKNCVEFPSCRGSGRIPKMQHTPRVNPQTPSQLFHTVKFYEVRLKIEVAICCAFEFFN